MIDNCTIQKYFLRSLWLVDKAFQPKFPLIVWMKTCFIGLKIDRDIVSNSIDDNNTINIVHNDH